MLKSGISKAKTGMMKNRNRLSNEANQNDMYLCQKGGPER